MAVRVIDHTIARLKAIRWAKDLLATDFVILDTETTALDSTGEIVQIAVVYERRVPYLLDIMVHTYIKPSVEIDEKSRAFEVSGISNKMVSEAPMFESVWPGISEAIGQRPIVAYNATYDQRMVRQSMTVRIPPLLYVDPHKWIDAMIPYSEFVGDWNHKFGNYKWQKLPGTQHGALADCIALLDLLKMMAAS